jgi:predicted esterase
MLPCEGWGRPRETPRVDRLDIDAEVRRWSGARTAGQIPLTTGARVMTSFQEPTAVWHTPDKPEVPLVVLVHRRGSNETEIIGLADRLLTGPAYSAVRAPVAEGGGYAWFANRGVGRPLTESLADDASPACRSSSPKGDADQMIPAELQTRTWDCLHGDSGAQLVARRSAGGRAITTDDLEALADWIASTL